MEEEYVFLEDCPICREGVGSIEHEGGFCVYVECLDCGSRTANFEYKNDAEKDEAERIAVHMWNVGKVIRMNQSE